MPPMETSEINKSYSELKKLNRVFYLQPLNSDKSNLSRIRIDSGRVYTIGRKRRHCDIIIDNRHVSKRHCQLFHNPFEHRLQLTDGCFLDKKLDPSEKVSLNGVFVNGERVEKGSVVELRDKDEILIGLEEKFIVEDCEDEVFDKTSERKLLASKAVSILDKCQSILNNTDPVSYLRNLEIGNSLVGVGSKQNDVDEVKLSGNDTADCSLRENAMIGIQHSGTNVENGTVKDLILNDYLDTHVFISKDSNRNDVVNKRNRVGKSLDVCNGDGLRQTSCSYNLDNKDDKHENGIGKRLAWSKNAAIEVIDLDDSDQDEDKNDKHEVILDENIKKGDSKTRKAIDKFDLGEASESNHYSSGKYFYLNRLENMGLGPEHEAKTITLPELLHPVKSILRVFLATFTSDVAWFLSYCQLPYHLPITIACHCAEKCWSSSRENRTSAPFSYYPNLLLVYPQFPDEIAFGKDRKKRGIACHHPKLIVLQRKDSIRVIITSANLNSKQWNYVTNTIWWQDFPSRSSPDCSSLFCTLQDTNNDFAAQLSGFIASLISNVTSQAHWITELTKYDFREAGGFLVASIPGIHSKRTFSETNHFILNKNVQRSQSDAKRYLGSIQVSVVGLSHRFCTGVDSGGQLKILASFLGKFQEISMGMLEVMLKRNTNIAADCNAMSVVVADIDEFSDGDSVQLGFLPRDIAKWVSPLSDAGFFSFSAFISPKETLTAILDGNNAKVPLVLHVLKGAKFDEISKLIQDDHVAPLCSLLSSIQRPLGLWRLHEVLSRYKWPDSLETDFMYVSSSIGTSINPQYIAAFSSAAGKRSVQFSESEESDPEWGCWTYNHELKNPSLRILFPTIERVKNALYGVCSSRRLLSLSEKTWKRLKVAGIFHDAVPNPSNRQGYPMHVKVAQRRFQYKKEGTPPFGWVYCGSHNFSPAAWGQESNIRGPKLHICNYELGIVLISPPYDAYSNKKHNREERYSNLDDIALPFVTPPPKYENNDRPATAQAMREAMAEAAIVQIEEMDEGVPSEDEEEEEEIEDEIVDREEHLVEEKEEEKIYAEMLWSQLDSCGS